MRDVTLYTVILDYGGGTYIAQLTAASAVAALPIWIARLNDEDLAEWGISRRELANITKDNGIVPMSGCVNVWCVSGAARKGLALINLIATQKGASTVERSGAPRARVRRRRSG